MCLTKSWPLGKAGKTTELGMKYSSFGVTGGFFPPLKTTNVDFKKRGVTFQKIAK